MKKGLYAILAALAVFALVMTGCDTGGGGDDPKKPDTPPVTGTAPVLSALTGFSKPVNTIDDITLTITVSNANTINATNLTIQWFKGSAATGTGTPLTTTPVAYNNSNNRTITPERTVGTAYYWVVAKNMTTGEETTSNRAQVTFGEAVTDTLIERIVSVNSNLPLWEFSLPVDEDGELLADWTKYTTFTIDYYVKKTSKAATENVRSRLYGAFIAADVDVPDQGDDKGWGGFRVVSWNGSKISRKDADGTTELVTDKNANFILDNSRGSASKLATLFASSNGVGVGKWFTASYTADGSAGHTSVKDFAKVTLLDEEDFTTIYLGAGIIQDGNDTTGAYEFFVRNPTLVHKTDTTLNIVGNRTATGTNEKFFVANAGAARSDTDRSVLTAGDDSYLDVAGEVTISFNKSGGTGGPAEAIKVLEGDPLPDDFFNAAGTDYATANIPTRTNWTFSGWYVVTATASTKVTTTTTFADNTTLVAQWEFSGTRLAHPYPSAVADTIVALGALNPTASNQNNQPGWEFSDTAGVHPSTADLVWATKFEFTLAKKFTGGCRLNWGSDLGGWGTGTHDTAITGNDGTPTAGVMTVVENFFDEDDNPVDDAEDADYSTFTYTVDLTKLALYSEMIYSQSGGQLYFQYWGGGEFTNFATIKPTDAKITIPKATP